MGQRTASTRDVWRYRWVILGIATFTQAASGFFVQGIGALGIHLQRDLDLSTAQLGLLVSAAQLVPLVGLLVAGELLDRYDCEMIRCRSERWPDSRYDWSWCLAFDLSVTAWDGTCCRRAGERVPIGASRQAPSQS